MLSTRVMTAIPLALFFLAFIVYAPPLAFAILLGVIALLGAWEWAALGGWQSPMRRSLFTVAMAVLLLAAMVGWLSHSVIVWLGMLLWLGLLMLVLRRARGATPQPLPAFFRLIIGLPVLLVAWVALVGIHDSTLGGPFWLIVLLVLVWSADIGAYFAGRRFGQHKLAVLISPGKTWEGAIGGLAAAFVGMGIVGLWGVNVAGYVSPSAGWWVLTGFLIVAVSVMGDLFESVLKRDAGVKDSGRILPGHGGVLDRIDALLPAAPVFYLALFGWQ